MRNASNLSNHSTKTQHSNMETIKHPVLLFLLLWTACEQVQGLKVVIEGLNGTLSQDSLSLPKQTRRLELASNQIRKIETGAICTTPLLRVVEISFKVNTDPPLLARNMFENCENITKLKIFGSLSRPSRLNDSVFQNLPNLKSLALRSYIVPSLTKDFFAGLTSLTDLVLSKCGIKEVAASAFEDLEGLEELKLDHNEISSLPSNLFKSVPHLKRLDLSNNNISLLDWNEFDGLSSLQDLDVSFNQISSFDVSKIVICMPKMERIVIKHNAVDCYTKEKIADELKHGFNHTVRVVFYDFIYFDYTDCEAEEYHRSQVLKSDQ